MKFSPEFNYDLKLNKLLKRKPSLILSHGHDLISMRQRRPSCVPADKSGSHERLHGGIIGGVRAPLERRNPLRPTRAFLCE